MNKRTVLRWTAALSIAAATVIGTIPQLWAEAPATQPSPGGHVHADGTVHKPAAEAKITPEAKAELDALAAAYSKLTSLDLAGTINVNIDVQGEKQNENASFTSSFQAPNKFRHAMKDDLVIGSTGEKSYLYSTSDKAYIQNDAPKTRADFAKDHSNVAAALNQQNRSLLVALSDPPTDVLLDQATDVKKIEDMKIGEKAYKTLAITRESEDVKLLIDPETHLIRQVQLDLSRAIKGQGAQDVKVATVIFDYTSSVPNAAVKDEQFAWAPPAGAKDMSKAARGEMMKDGEGAAMVGKPAPDFSLPGMDDKAVTLAAQKGSVVILDFWATWCGPCVAGLPHLDKLYQEKKEAGLKVFAIDQGEEKDVVAAFIEKKKLGIPVLLDAEGKVGNLYGVSGIPHQVVIGKDGNVKKVTVGFSPKEVEALRKVVEEEMAAK